MQILDAWSRIYKQDQCTSYNLTCVCKNMERVNVSVVLMILVLLGTSVVMPTSALPWNFAACYAKCMFPCEFGKGLPACAGICLKRCSGSILLREYQGAKDNDCTLECATSRCATISTKDSLRKNYFLTSSIFFKIFNLFYMWLVSIISSNFEIII